MISKEFLDNLDQQPIESFLKDLKKALLILHSPQDEIVGIENAEKIYKSAWHPKSFVSLDGANHLVTNQSDADYIGQVLSSWSLRYVDQQDKIENDTKGHP